MEKSVPSAKKKFSIRDIMTIAAMMVICFIIMMVMSSLTLPFPLVYLYGSAGIDGFICAVFFLVAANRVNKHGLLFAWAGIYGLIQGVMGYMFLFPYFLAVGLIAELSMLGKDTYRNPLRTRIGWTINCVGNFVGCAVPLWWAWDSYTAMALESGFTSETLEMQMAMVTSPALMLLGAAITAVLLSSGHCLVSAYCGSTSKKPVLWDEQNRYDTKANRAGRWADGLIFDRLLLPGQFSNHRPDWPCGVHFLATLDSLLFWAI